MAYQDSDLISYDIRTVDRASDRLLAYLRTVICKIVFEAIDSVEFSGTSNLFELFGVVRKDFF